MIFIFWSKKQNNESSTDKWLSQLRKIQEDIRVLEKRKNEIDTPKFLSTEKGSELAERLILIWNGRCDARCLTTLSKNKNDMKFLEDFAYYLLALCDSGEEYSFILEELKEKRNIEKTLKEKLSIE